MCKSEEDTTLLKKIKLLEHAFTASAGAYYNLNLTRNLVPGTMYQVIDDVEYSVNEQIGMQENAAYTDVIDYWVTKVEESDRKRFLEFFKISSLLKHHEQHDDHVWCRFWTKNSLLEPMLAEQHVVMYEDEDSRDVLAITYILDQTEDYKEDKYRQMLEQNNKELTRLLDMERQYRGILSALSHIDWTVYNVDVKAGTYTEICDGKEFKLENLYNSGTNWESFRHEHCRMISETHQKLLREFLDHTTLKERLHDTDLIYMDYCTLTQQWIQTAYVVQQRDHAGNVTRALFTLRNITEQKQAEFRQQEILKEAAAASEAANKAKSQFLFNMSHDLRTPLNGIIGLLKINRAHFDDYELVKANNAKMLETADYLLALVNNVLQMSKIESGSMELDHEVIDLRELSRDLRSILINRIADEGITAESGGHELTAPYVYGSPVHLKQIFINIYSNCIKYNKPNGSIKTSLECADVKDDIITYRWIISDTGIGMSSEFLQHIFEPFRQENPESSSKYHGTGLGMPIVKSLIERMNGTIEVESEKGVGSTFIVTIPFEIAEAPEKSVSEETAQPKDILKGIKLLMAEDNELNAEIAETILQDHGAEVTTVKNGLEAVDRFRESREGEFDAIMMDILMPVMNGLDASRNIRASERPDAKTIPIIAMTANAFKEDEQKCLDAGMNAHLAKPFNIGELISVILKLTRKQG